MVILSGCVLTKPLVTSQAGLSLHVRVLSVNSACLTHPLQELLQLERLFLPQFVPQLLRLQLFLLMFLLRLCNGSVKNMETNHSSLSVPPYQQRQTLIGTRACLDVLGGNLKRKRGHSAVSGPLLFRQGFAPAA